MTKIQKLRAQINALKGQIASLKSEAENKWMARLVEEIHNLMDEVGDGFVLEDDYTTSRYYSAIPGVKNIRITENEFGKEIILAKIDSPLGEENLPNTINVEGKTIDVFIVRSKSYHMVEGDE